MNATSQMIKDGEMDARNWFLRQCRFESYSDYLVSDLWASIKKSLDEAIPRTCGICGATTGLQWHHRRYSPDVLVGNFSARNAVDTPIVRLCGLCHSAIHHTESGEFISDLNEVDQRLRAGKSAIERMKREGREGVERLKDIQLRAELDQLKIPPPVKSWDAD